MKIWFGKNNNQDFFILSSSKVQPDWQPYHASPQSQEKYIFLVLKK
jgi:hypothetical protein